jgi:hypothetical protein
MGTSGRVTLASEALACFLAQTAIEEATLLVYNQHPIPLRFDHPRVRIVNEKPPPGSLRHIRARMHALADPDAEFLHWWDDDDLYLPWHIEESLAHIGGAAAWKPERSWFWRPDGAFSLERNTFEGSWTFRAAHLKAAPLDTHPDYTDHPVIRQTVEAGALATADPGGRASYIYRWSTGGEHVSAYAHAADEAAQGEHLATWRARSTDFRLGGRLEPADLSPRWRAYLEATRPILPDAVWQANRIGVGIAPSDGTGEGRGSLPT